MSLICSLFHIFIISCSLIFSSSQSILSYSLFSLFFALLRSFFSSHIIILSSSLFFPTLIFSYILSFYSLNLSPLPFLSLPVSSLPFSFPPLPSPSFILLFSSQLNLICKLRSSIKFGYMFSFAPHKQTHLLSFASS